MKEGNKQRRASQNARDHNCSASTTLAVHNRNALPLCEMQQFLRFDSAAELQNVSAHFYSHLITRCGKLLKKEKLSAPVWNLAFSIFREDRFAEIERRGDRPKMTRREYSLLYMTYNEWHAKDKSTDQEKAFYIKLVEQHEKALHIAEVFLGKP